MSSLLDFEQPIIDLAAKIEELKQVTNRKNIDLSNEISKLELKSQKLTREIFSSLNAWQITQIARHPDRPHSLDYIEHIFTDYQELSGDRMYANDEAIVGGLARIDGIGVVVIGHQKGRDTKEKVRRNFGMPCPEGYRKAQRLARMAEKFNLPIITLIDTPGAYPGIGAEERGQSQAIAESISLMTEVRSPIVSIVIGEGGSGGALAIGVSDILYMLEFSTYSVISPEGCASILWKSTEKSQAAADAMKITASDLKKFGLIDEIIKEPLGGAHRNHFDTATDLKKCILKSINTFETIDIEDLLFKRRNRLRSFGEFQERI